MTNPLRNGKRLVSVCGKGGTGKTVVTAMMARALVDSGRAGKLLVIDADPALGQLSALGAKVDRTMGEVREEIIKTAQLGRKEEKSALAGQIDYMAFEAMQELDDFAILAMGRTEKLGCYCPVNSLLRGAIESLSDSFDTILIDGEAGLEQINRQIVRHLDTLLIVSDPSSRGLETAAVVRDMVRDEKVIGCDKMGIVFNRVSGHEDLLRRSAENIDVEVFGMIPQDDVISEHDILGRPITELPADCAGLAAVRHLVEERVLS